MWVFLNKSFLSIVEDNVNKDYLLVRSRFKGDILAVFPGETEAHTPEADYAYRAWVPRQQVAVAISKAVTEINYPNFKSSVKDDDRHDTYMDVWIAARGKSSNAFKDLSYLADDYPSLSVSDLWIDEEDGSINS